MTSHPHFLAPISEEIWNLKYRLKSVEGAPVDAALDDTIWRVARAAAAPEKGGKRQREKWAARFHDAIADYGFLPAGRILAGAGTGRHVTLFSCFVMGTIEDSIEGIFDSLKEGALTMQRGGGIGYDFSPLRPRGSRARATGMTASGPVSFLELWDAMCSTMLSTGARRGAMMGTLSVTHPDILEFIDAKRDPAVLRNFNLSVLVTDAFLETLPLRDQFKARMTELYDYERFGIPEKKGGRYFYTRNDGLQNQSVLFVRDRVDGEGRVLIDPNGWSADGATALAEWVPSEDGKHLLYSIQDGGTDWRTVRVLDAARQTVSLESPVGVEGDTVLGDFIEDKRSTAPLESAAHHILREQIDIALQKLPERERRIIQLRYGLYDGQYRTLEEVGREFGITRERIRQIEARVLRKLRHPHYGRNLRGYLE